MGHPGHGARGVHRADTRWLTGSGAEARMLCGTEECREGRSRPLRSCNQHEIVDWRRIQLQEEQQRQKSGSIVRRCALMVVSVACGS